MPRRLHVSHRIVVDPGRPGLLVFHAGRRGGVGLAVEVGQGPDSQLVTTTGGESTAGSPTYVYPSDGRTEPGMVHRSRYVRSTPASRTEVQVYVLTALNAAGERVLEDFEGQRFTAMIDGWACKIAECRELLLAASIR